MVKSLRPQNYNEVLYVGHYFRKGVPVLMDLTDLPDGDAKRLVDFATGLVFGRGGAFDRVDRKLFLLQP
ncbi:cell division protein SepF [Spirillospora sp. NPDC049024]|uniref:cell division protein SepF n=1 Tax=unclassified Actinomadura TaxID=2626254 RepID=UPI0011EC7B48|nr:cell division protein SepF [Actinomadura sp. K4S16]